MCELWEESDYEMPKDEQQRTGSKEAANQRTPKSDREPENIYSAKRLGRVWG